jgi:hypothetical protein
MLGATETSMGPDVAPEGMTVVIEAEFQLLIVTGEPFSVTTLLAWIAPNPEPVITTCVPTGPVVADRPFITGAGAAVELIDTLSKVAVERLALL